VGNAPGQGACPGSGLGRLGDHIQDCAASSVHRACRAWRRSNARRCLAQIQGRKLSLDQAGARPCAKTHFLQNLDDKKVPEVQNDFSFEKQRCLSSFQETRSFQQGETS
jgi:hypothetical protein